jgi:DNA-binding FrmR family transcriptional regulator
MPSGSSWPSCTKKKQKPKKTLTNECIELDRIEGKIQALTEMSVSNQDPDYISSQVDSVADSMAQTEEAIRDLQYITGLSDDMESAPEILETNLAEVIEA